MNISYKLTFQGGDSLLSHIAAYSDVSRFFCELLTKGLGVSCFSFSNLDTDKTIAGNDNANYQWVIISKNGALIDIRSFIKQNLPELNDDMVFVNIDRQLNGYSESARITNEKIVAGFCRNFDDKTIEINKNESEPDCIIINTKVFDKIDSIGLDFESIVKSVQENNFSVKYFLTAGDCFEINKDSELLSCLTEYLPKNTDFQFISKSARVHKSAILKGSCVIMPGAAVEADSCLCNCIIGANLTVGSGIYATDIVALKQKDIDDLENVKSRAFGQKKHHLHRLNGFLRHGVFFYPRFLKRIFDILFSSVMIVIFFPVLFLVAIAVKLTSKGPIFFKARRQGLFGKEFKCLKFRSMMVGADDIQQGLRAVNEVDGPQFKMDKDPRITVIGEFLRKTCLDELPQFFNVLLGDMSVVGPRPSPESENMLCPYWRDARLSVRPGITGYWQVSRTRKPQTDFQEWVLYDTKYVREISFWTDFKVCFKTAAKLINDFLDQF